MDNETEGIWSHIVKNSPSPERDEISQLIGTKLIDDNQNLWRESLAIKSIVKELNIPRATTANTKDSNTKVTGKRSILTAKSFSIIHDDDELNSKSTIAPGSRAKKIQNIQWFTLESVVSIVADIRRGLEVENTELEMEVDRLNREMESQAESIFTFKGGNSNNNNQTESTYRTNTNKMDDSKEKTSQCKVCGMKLFTKRGGGSDPLLTISSNNNSQHNNNAKASIAFDMCEECEELCLRRDSKLSGSQQPPPRSTSFTNSSSASISTSVSDQFSQMNVIGMPPLPLSTLSNNNQHSTSSQSSDNSARSTPRSGSNGATSSRFRSRLNTARDEHDERFFLEE